MNIATLVVFLSISAAAQVTTPNPIVFPGVPIGSCSSPNTAVNTANGDFYTCSASAWVKVASAGSGIIGSPSSGVEVVGNGSNFVTQIKSSIDVRDIAGVDCTATTDSSTALNALWDTRLGGNINGAHIIFPGTCQIRTDNPLVIFGQSYFWIDGLGREPVANNGAVIFGCNGTAGAVLQITRSGHAKIQGISIAAKGLSCTSNFTGSVLLNNDVSGGVTTTDIDFEDMDINTNRGGTQITNYTGVQIGLTGASQNTERISISNSSILCGSSSPGSIGIYVVNGTSDHDQIMHNQIVQCFIGIKGNLGGIVQGNNLSNGSFPIFGVGGANYVASGCAGNQLVLTANEMAENAGQFYVQTVGAGCQNVLMLENIMNTSAVDPSVFAIDVGNGIGKLTMINNNFNMISGNSQPTVGTSQSATAMSNTNIVDIGNVSNTGLFQNVPVAQGLLSFSGVPISWSKSVLLTPGNPAGVGGFGNNSPSLNFRTNQYVGSSTNYDYAIGSTISRNSSNRTTFYLDNLANNPLASLAIMPAIAGGLTTIPLAWGTSTPTVATHGTAGLVSYSYVVCAEVAVSLCAPSATATIATGNATLDTNNYNVVSWFPIPGAAEYCVYRSASAGAPASTGLLTGGCLSASIIGQVISGELTLNDTGLVADGTTTPSTNTADGRINTVGNITGKRLSVDSSTTLTSGAFTLGAGWGSTAAIAITVTTSKDPAYVVTITTGGSGITANPTLQITFADGTWTNVPVCHQIQTGGNDIFGDTTVTARSATLYTYQWAGTPTTGKTYEFTQTCTGT